MTTLSEADVDRIAARVAELLNRATSEGEKEWVTADVIAKSFGVSRSWVYKNADALGALRIGQGQNGRLRFDPRLVWQRVKAVGAPPAPNTSRKRSKRRRRSDVGELLPIRERPRTEGA